ncbi:hypothetical protein [Allobaculum stercoricanis]|uniref:hypothetical protein n=1 Tax=Allobaculum stercoricanis TaxID=174709 RepID=UPI0023F02DCD|nr:hypothetical protein [Allobaculum stercoricanis]
MTIIIYVLTILLAIAVFFIIKNKRYKVVPFVSGVILIFFGGCLLISMISLVVPYGEILIFPLGCIVLGVVVILAALNDFYSLVRCKDKVDGIYHGYNTYYGGNGVSTQAPVFEYMYNGTLYKEQTAQTVSYKLLTQKMRNGQTYNIYVDPKHPAVFILQKKIKVSSILTVIFGIMFFSTGIMTLWELFPVFWRLIQ